MELQMSMRQEKIKFATIVGIITFSTVFLVTGMLMSTVYGAEIPTKEYNETLEITKNATEFTEGNHIKNYIENVKQDICKTLVNATEYEKCLEL